MVGAWAQLRARGGTPTSQIATPTTPRPMSPSESPSSSRSGSMGRSGATIRIRCVRVAPRGGGIPSLAFGVSALRGPPPRRGRVVSRCGRWTTNRSRPWLVPGSEQPRAASAWRYRCSCQIQGGWIRCASLARVVPALRHTARFRSVDLKNLDLRGVGTRRYIADPAFAIGHE